MWKFDGNNIWDESDASFLQFTRNVWRPLTRILSRIFFTSILNCKVDESVVWNTSRIREVDALLKEPEIILIFRNWINRNLSLNLVDQKCYQNMNECSWYFHDFSANKRLENWWLFSGSKKTFWRWTEIFLENWWNYFNYYKTKFKYPHFRDF